MDIQALLEMGRQAATLIDSVTGTPFASMAVKAGDAVLELIDNVKETAAVTDVAALDETREALEARINAHADKTISSLGNV